MTGANGSVRPHGRALMIAAGGGLLLAAIAAWQIMANGRGDGSEASPLVTLPASGIGPGTRAGLAIPAAARAPLPSSLAGTAVDGGFTIDGRGHFVPDRNALRVFDYFLSAGGEESEEVLRGRILLHAINGGLADSAVAEIAAVLDRYIAYRSAARAALATGTAAPADLGARVAAMRGLQTMMLGPDLAKAFYGDDGDLADIELRRMTILRNAAMTQDERERALAAIDAELPPGIRSARTVSAAPTALHLKVEALRAAGGSDADIAAMRRSEYGAAAAERLAELDGARARWEQRLAAYRREDQRLRADHGGQGNAAYRQAQDALRQRHFSGSELARVRALDAEAR